MDISSIKKILLKSIVPLVRRFQGHHVLLINLHNMPLMDIMACTKYIKGKQTDSIFKYTLINNNFGESLNVKIVLLTENLEKLIKHLELDFEQYTKEMADWLDMLDERRITAASSTLPRRPVDPNSSGEENSDVDKDEYIHRLVINRLNRMFPYSR